MMLAAPWMSQSSGPDALVLLLVLPILAIVFRMEHRPSTRRMYTAVAFVIVAASTAIYASDIVVMHPCELCRLYDDGSWFWWFQCLGCPK